MIKETYILIIAKKKKVRIFDRKRKCILRLLQSSLIANKKIRCLVQVKEIQDRENLQNETKNIAKPRKEKEKISKSSVVFKKRK